MAVVERKGGGSIRAGRNMCLIKQSLPTVHVTKASSHFPCFSFFQSQRAKGTWSIEPVPILSFFSFKYALFYLAIGKQFWRRKDGNQKYIYIGCCMGSPEPLCRVLGRLGQRSDDANGEHHHFLDSGPKQMSLTQHQFQLGLQERMSVQLSKRQTHSPQSCLGTDHKNRTLV